MRWVQASDSLSCSRGDVVVAVIAEGPWTGAIARAVRNMVGRSPGATVLLLGVRRGDLGVDALELLGELEIAATEARPDWSSGDHVDEVVRSAAPADLVLVRAGLSVGPGWLQRLQGAAMSDDTVATVTPVDDNMVQAVPARGAGLEAADAQLAKHAVMLRPRIQIGGADCLYTRRRALELVGDVPRKASLAAVTAALCEQCVRVGMVNILADDVYVGGGRSGAPELSASAQSLAAVDLDDERSPLRHCTSLSDSLVRGVDVTIDARSLTATFGGTQLYTTELLIALSRFTDARVRAVVAPDIPQSISERLADARVTIVSYDQAIEGVEPAHVVHRPQQVFTPSDLELLRRLSARLVVTQQDLIAYRNPGYHESVEVWQQYRRVTRLALAVADRVVTFSEHSRRDVLREELTPEDRCDVIGAAPNPGPPGPGRRPPDLSEDEPFIVCLGADYRHKNRPFAIALLRALREEYGWQGLLVLAGGRVAHGSSRDEEEAALARDPDLDDAVIDLGPVDQAAHAWLAIHARAFVVPSVVEGFGLVPLEAGEAGVPCLFADQASLGEVAGALLATIVPWSASDSAARARPLLDDGPDRERHVEALRAAAHRWRWERLAGELMTTYERTLRSPFRAGAPHSWQQLERERHLSDLERSHEKAQLAYQELSARVGDRVSLATEDGPLSARQQRGLMRAGSRPALSKAMLWPFSLLGAPRLRGKLRR